MTEWPEIEALLRQLYLVQKGLASKELRKAEPKTCRKTDSTEAKEKHISLVKQRGYPLSSLADAVSKISLIKARYKA